MGISRTRISGQRTQSSAVVSFNSRSSSCSEFFRVETTDEHRWTPMSVASLCVHRCSSVVPCLGGMSVAMRERNRIRIPVLGSAVFALSFASSLSQMPPQNAKQESAIRARVAEVILDVVVTDKKGRQITDLDPSEFEILEDGVRQNIVSSRVVGTDEPPTESSKPAAPQQTARPATQVVP